jgi:hypothetical protein
MTTHPPRSRTIAAIQARRENTHRMLQHIHDAITTLNRQKATISVAAIARQAGVSRTFLYENPEARTLVSDAVNHAGRRRAEQRAEHNDQQETSWRERALNAEDALKTVRQEIQSQRSRIAILMGQIRDMEHQFPADAAARLTTENTALKQRIQKLTQTNRSLEERLSAARSNTRFQDRKIAQLEAQLLDPATSAP